MARANRDVKIERVGVDRNREHTTTTKPLQAPPISAGLIHPSPGDTRVFGPQGYISPSNGQTQPQFSSCLLAAVIPTSLIYSVLHERTITSLCPETQALPSNSDPPRTATTRSPFNTRPPDHLLNQGKWRNPPPPNTNSSHHPMCPSNRARGVPTAATDGRRLPTKNGQSTDPRTSLPTRSGRSSSCVAP